jgi:hypothetical protein
VPFPLGRGRGGVQERLQSLYRCWIATEPLPLVRMSRVECDGRHQRLRFAARTIWSALLDASVQARLMPQRPRSFLDHVQLPTEVRHPVRTRGASSERSIHKANKLPFFWHQLRSVVPQRTACLLLICRIARHNLDSHTCRPCRPSPGYAAAAAPCSEKARHTLKTSSS